MTKIRSNISIEKGVQHDKNMFLKDSRLHPEQKRSNMKKIKTNK